MSGDRDRGSGKPAGNAFASDRDGERPLPRARRPKPPPGIITAGGVDMARAHASGIRVPGSTSPATPRDEPRVVLAVQTDPRRVPTPRRLLEGRAKSADGTRAALLPATPGEETILSRPRASADRQAQPAAAAPGAEPPLQEKMAMWMRASLVAALTLLALGFARRVGHWLAPPEPLPVVVESAPPPLPPPAPPLPEPPPKSTAAATAAHVEPAPVEPLPARTVVAAARPARPAPAVTTAAPAAESASPHTAKAPPSATPKAAFAPPFELPGEKSQEP
jgi:hypothetical protein